MYAILKFGISVGSFLKVGNSVSW